jgi:cytochrome c oxidase assembly protein subunit 15
MSLLDTVDAERLTVGLVDVTLLVIVLGGVIRIYDAGESCPDWPTCFGTWGFNVSEADQQAWYEANPDEFDSRGPSHRYTSFQIFTEWSHRLIAGFVLGPLVLVNWWLLRQDDGFGSEVRLASTVSVALIVWQGAVGWLTVRMDNEHWSVALHLGSALAFALSLIWIWLAVSKDRGGSPEWIDFDPAISPQWRGRLAWLSVGAFVTLFSGTFVSTTPGANFGCGVNGMPKSWPLCNGGLVDSMEDVIAQSQIIHRWLVVIVEIGLIAASYAIWKQVGDEEAGNVLRNWIWIATGLFIANQLVGGLYILSWDMEDGYMEFLSLIHLLLASLTFLTLAIAWLGSAMAVDRRGS